MIVTPTDLWQKGTFSPFKLNKFAVTIQNVLRERGNSSFDARRVFGERGSRQHSKRLPERGSDFRWILMDPVEYSSQGGMTVFI